MPSEAPRSDHYDVAIVGAGCAGALAAHQLARTGASVLLVDKSRWPRDKVCGGCLNERALHTLRATGLPSLVEKAGGVPIQEFHVGARGTQAHVALPGGMCLSRKALDAALVEAAEEAGAEFRSRTTARLGERCEAEREVVLRTREGERTIRARIVLAADGLGARLLHSESEPFEAPANSRAHIGAGVMLDTAPPDTVPGVIYMACGKRGYVGWVHAEHGRLDMAAAFDPAFVKQQGGLAPAALHVQQEAGFEPIEAARSAPWKGTPALTRGASRLTAHRFFVVGDAAGYVEPFTGEGMAWALAGGHALAPIVAQALQKYDKSLEEAWVRTYRTAITRRQLTCRALAAGLRRPRLTEAAVRLLRAAPALASPVVNRLNLIAP